MEHKYFLSKNFNKDVGYVYSLINFINLIKIGENKNLDSMCRTENRDEFEKYLNDNGVGTTIHYPRPMHLQEAYKDLNIKEGELPIAEKIANEVISIPMYYGMKEEEIQYVIDVINKW